MRIGEAGCDLEVLQLVVELDDLGGAHCDSKSQQSSHQKKSIVSEYRPRVMKLFAPQECDVADARNGDEVFPHRM